MKYNDFYCKKLDETIYIINNKLDNNQVLETFFSQLYGKSKNNPNDILSSILIFPCKLGAKISDGNGIYPYLHSTINITRFLNKKRDYLSISGLNYPYLYQEENDQIMNNAVEIKLLNRINRLTVMITTNLEELSIFQLKALNKIVKICNIMKEKQLYESVIININSPRNFFEADENKKINRYV